MIPFLRGKIKQKSIFGDAVSIMHISECVLIIDQLLLLRLPWAQSGYLVADQHIAAFRKTVGAPTIRIISRLGGSSLSRGF